MWVSCTQNHEKKNTIFIVVNPYLKTFDGSIRKVISHSLGELFSGNCYKSFDDLTEHCILLKGYDQTRYNRVKRKLKGDRKYIYETFTAIGSKLSFIYLTDQYRSYCLERHTEKILCDEAQQIQEHNQLLKNPLFHVFGKKTPMHSLLPSNGDVENKLF